MFGKYHSEETKKKIGRASKGRYHSEKTKKKIGKANFGNKNSAILDETKVKEIRRLSYIDHIEQKEIADKFEISKGCVNGILQGYNWNPNNLNKEELLAETLF